MTQKIKITEAYCVQLDKIVDIDEAHAESMKTTPSQRFDFLCSSPICRQQGVKITGVSYHMPVSQQQKTMHFRENSAYIHDDSCEWVVLSQFLHHETLHTGETEQQAEIRKRSASAVHDWITQYSPYKPDTGVHVIDEEVQQAEVVQHIDNQNKNNPVIWQGQHGRTTHSFYRLCRFHHEMLELNGFAALKNVPLYIMGSGMSSLGKYFQPIKYALFQKNCVLFGLLGKDANGKYRIRSYGQNGFKVVFAAKFEHTEYGKLPISLYISTQQIMGYRNRKQILDVLENAQNFAEITIYVIPNNINIHEYNSGAHEIQIILSDLDHFRFVGKASD